MTVGRIMINNNESDLHSLGLKPGTPDAQSNALPIDFTISSESRQCHNICPYNVVVIAQAISKPIIKHHDNNRVNIISMVRIS
jgi:hypothetical protein